MSDLGSFVVYCDAPSHRHGRNKIRTLVVDRDGDLYQAAEDTWLSGTDIIDPNVVRRRYFDDPIPNLRMRPEFCCNAPVRSVENMPAATCNRSVPIADTSRLAHVIRTCWGHGVSEISLAGLEARLRS